MRESHQILTKRSYNNIFSRENIKFIVYKGSSMSYTFQDMDVLYYIPNKRIKPGDVVVFKISEYDQKIIHRVISTGKEGIKTMGDYNPCPDSWLLRPDQIMGSIAYGYRGRRRLRVLGGLAGLAQMFQVRLKRLTIRAMYPILNLIFYNFPISDLTILLIRPISVAFKRPNGTELHLLARGRVIGRRPPGQEWQIKLPFRFFLDEDKLPD